MAIKTLTAAVAPRVDRAAITLPSVTEEDLQSLKTNNVVNIRHEEGIKLTQEISC